MGEAGLPQEKMASALSEPDESMSDFIFQQTMYRIKDPEVSLKFYSNVLGMRLLKRIDMPSMKFTAYFMGYEDKNQIPQNEDERTTWAVSRKATLELTHNWGTESDPNFGGYHNGNSEPKGFGHIGIMVPDVYKACERFEKLGVTFAKKPDGGSMKDLAFIKDPDGYMIEIFNNESLLKILHEMNK